MELATSASEDHRVVASDILLRSDGVRFRIDARRPPQINVANTSNLAAQRCFQDMLWQRLSRCSQNGTIDQQLKRTTDIVRTAAVQAFGRAQRTPRQPWVSQCTWLVIKYAAPLRRAMVSSQRVLRRELLRYALLSWCALIPASFVPLNQTGDVHHAGLRRFSRRRRC